MQTIFATIQQPSCPRNHPYLIQLFNLKCCQNAVATLLLDWPLGAPGESKDHDGMAVYPNIITQFYALKSRFCSFPAAFPCKYMAKSLSPHPLPPPTSSAT